MELITIKMLRTKLNKSQKEMAKILGVTERTYQRKERNPNKFTFKEVKTMCQLGNVNLENIDI